MLGSKPQPNPARRQVLYAGSFARMGSAAAASAEAAEGKTAKKAAGDGLGELRNQIRTMRFGQMATKIFEASCGGSGNDRPDTAASAIARAAESANGVSGAAKQLAESLAAGDAKKSSDAERYDDLFGSAMALFAVEQSAAIDAYVAVEMIMQAAKKSGVKLQGVG